MPRGKKRTHCRICGKPFVDGETGTRSGAHLKCGIDRMISHNQALMDGTGEDYEHWLRRSQQGAAQFARSV